MKKIVHLLIIALTFYACENNISDKFEIIEKNRMEKASKIELKVKLSEIVNETELKEIANKLRKQHSNYKKIYIFYLLPEHSGENGAWAISHFKPELELEIIGSTEVRSDDKIQMSENETLVSEWVDNDPTLPANVYLIKLEDKLVIKTKYKKNKYSKGETIEKEVTKISENGKTRFDYDNKFGEYYVIEENGNLGYYDNDGKFKEAQVK